MSLIFNFKIREKGVNGIEGSAGKEMMEVEVSVWYKDEN